MSKSSILGEEREGALLARGDDGELDIAVETFPRAVEGLVSARCTLVLSLFTTIGLGSCRGRASSDEKAGEYGRSEREEELGSSSPELSWVSRAGIRLSTTSRL